MFKVRWVINKKTAERVLQYYNGAVWITVPICFDIQIELDHHGKEIKDHQTATAP